MIRDIKAIGYIKSNGYFIGKAENIEAYNTKSGSMMVNFNEEFFNEIDKYMENISIEVMFINPLSISIIQGITIKSPIDVLNKNKAQYISFKYNEIVQGGKFDEYGHTTFEREYDCTWTSSEASKGR